MTRSTLELLSRIVARRTGVFIKPEQQQGVVSRFVAGRSRALRLSSPDEYVDLVGRQGLADDEFTRLVAAVTNQHTFFFRDAEQFRSFADLLRVWRAAGPGRTLQIWSAGCATGEEPYSLAMLCQDLGIDARILATDICVEAVELARAARYRPWALRRLPDGYLERFFAPDGENLVLDPGVADLVRIELHNLVDGPYPGPERGGWDWILCRNVLIYFSEAAAAQVARRLAEALDPEGWVFLGAAEQPTGFEELLLPWPLGLSYGFRLLRPPESYPVRPTPAAPAPAVPPPPAAPTGKAETTGPPLFVTIVELVRRDDLSGAGRALERLLAADPNHLAARVTLGNLHLRQHAFVDAVTEYQQALAASPLIPEAHYLLGVVYRKVGDLERSARSLRQALFLEPGFWCAAFLLAGVEGRLGHEPARRRHLRHTLSLLDDATPGELFSSCVIGMQDVALEPEEVRRLCRRHLGA